MKEKRKEHFFISHAFSLISFSHFLSILEKKYSLISYSSSSLSVRGLWLCPYPAMTSFGLAPGKNHNSLRHDRLWREKGNKAYVCFRYKFP